jgi:hypothetical protein
MRTVALSARSMRQQFRPGSRMDDGGGPAVPAEKAGSLVRGKQHLARMVDVCTYNKAHAKQRRPRRCHRRWRGPHLVRAGPEPSSPGRFDASGARRVDSHASGACVGFVTAPGAGALSMATIGAPDGVLRTSGNPPTAACPSLARPRCDGWSRTCDRRDRSRRPAPRRQ